MRERVQQLDGSANTLVTVRGPGDAHLSIGGDARTGPVLCATLDNVEFHQRIAPVEGDNDAVEVVAGRQPGRYPRRQIVSVDQALTAAEAFVRRGELPGSEAPGHPAKG